MLDILPVRRVRLATRHVAWIALGFFGMLVVLGLILMRVGADRLLQSSQWYGTLDFKQRTIGWDGKIALTQAAFVPHAGAGAAMRAERVSVDVGGPLALMRVALRRGSPERLERRRQELQRDGVFDANNSPPVLPANAKLRVDAEGVSVDSNFIAARWLPWLDPSNGVLFASLGCRELPGLSASVARRAGDSGRLDVRFGIAPGEESTRLSVDIAMGGIGRARWTAGIVLPEDTGLLAGDWRQWRLAEQEWRLDDRQFVRARNRECARRVGLARPQFIARHALAVKRRLSRWRIALPEPLESAYREHASLGGEIVFRSRPLEPLRLGDYALMSRSQRLGALDGQIVIADHRLPFLLEFLPPRRSRVAREATAATTREASAAGVGLPVAAGPAADASSNAKPTGDSGTGALDGKSPATAVAAVVAAGARSSAQTGVKPGSARVDPPVKSTTSRSRVANEGPVQLGTPSMAQEDTGPASVTPEMEPTTPETARLPSQGNYAGLLGQRVAILTRLGTTRTGTLSVANRIAVTIQTPVGGNMVELRIPAEDIVRLTAVR